MAAIIPQNTNPKYQIFVRDKDGNVLGEINNWYNLKFNDRLNNFGECTFDIPSNSQDLLKFVSLRRYETLIYRNGTLVWAGEQAVRNGKLKANDPQLITITSYTFVEMLNSMFTPAYVRYDLVDQGEILKDLVDVYQAQTGADLGLTFATIEPTMDRDRDYTYSNILEAFINMSNVINGIDFYITPDKVVHIVPERGIDQSTQMIFEFGINLLDAIINENFSSPANQVIVLGSGFGAEQAVGGYIDTVSRGIYKLRQQVVSEIDVSKQSNLDDKAEAFANKYKQALSSIEGAQIPNSYPTFGLLSIGDSARYRIKEGVYNIDATYRIYGYQVNIGSNGEENLAYTVAIF